MKKFRFLQLITGIHYIHHLYYSYGHKLPFIKLAYFKDYGWRVISRYNNKKITLCNNQGKKIKPYHNCTLTGKY